MPAAEPATETPFRSWFAPILAASLAFLSLRATDSGYGYAIDEATYVWVAEELREWFAELPQRGLGDSLSREGIARRWHFLEPPGARPLDRHSNFNLPVSVYVLDLGWLVAHRWLPELQACRLGNELLWALAVGATFRVLQRERGIRAATFAAIALCTCPRMFGHAHLAATETALVAMWLFALLALISATRSNATWKSAVVFGLTLGVAFATKMTIWLSAPLLFFWLVAFRPSNWKAILAAMAVLPLPIVVALTPNLWHSPIDGLIAMVRGASDNPWKIGSYYLGRCYAGSPPWESSFVLTAVTIPVAWLLLGLLGTWFARRDRVAALFAVNAWGLLAFRAAGLVPGHDVERQFLPALVFFGLTGAVALDRLVGMIRPRPLAIVLAAVLIAEPLAEAWKYRTHGLCYYSRLVGGLDGAAKLGFEVSYWFECLDDDAWKHLLEPLPDGARVFFRPDHPGLREGLRGAWPARLRVADRPEDADYYLFYARKSAYWVPTPAGFISTDFARIEASGRAVREIRFDGVRLAGVFRR